MSITKQPDWILMPGRIDPDTGWLDPDMASVLIGQPATKAKTPPTERDVLHALLIAGTKTRAARPSLWLVFWAAILVRSDLAVLATVATRAALGAVVLDVGQTLVKGWQRAVFSIVAAILPPPRYVGA